MFSGVTDWHTAVAAGHRALLRSAILAPSDEGAGTPNGVTGGERMLKSFGDFGDLGVIYLSLSPKSEILDSSLVRGSLCALRALSPRRGDKS